MGAGQKFPTIFGCVGSLVVRGFIPDGLRSSPKTIQPNLQLNRIHRIYDCCAAGRG